MKTAFLLIFAFTSSLTGLFTDSKVKGYTNYDIQAAIDYEADRGGGVVFLSEGEYKLRNAIYLKDNIELIGVNQNVKLKKCPRFSSRIINEIAKGDRWINVQDETVFQCGDGVTVFSKSLKAAQAWMSEIIEILPGALLLKDKAPANISLSSSPVVYSSFPCVFCKKVRSASIKDLTIDGNRKKNPVIDSWWDSGIGCQNSKKIEIVNVRVLNSPGDGISLNTAHEVKIIDSKIKGSARIGIHVGSGSLYTYLGNCEILNSGVAGVINIDGLFLCQSASFGLYEKNVISGARRAGISIGLLDSGNLFFNNTVIKNQIGVLFRKDSHETANLVFLENQIEKNRSWDLLMQKPVHNIFMDVYPEKSMIHPKASFLYYMDFPQNSWVRFQ